MLRHIYKNQSSYSTVAVKKVMAKRNGNENKIYITYNMLLLSVKRVWVPWKFAYNIKLLKSKFHTAGRII